MSTALYIHVPVCLRKCAYCDFVSSDALCSRTNEVASALKVQLYHLAPTTFSRENPVYSVYFGGGTPTALGEDLLGLVDEVMTLPGAHNAEITVETNPETTDPTLISELVARGVNRFSIGIQSFHENELRALGRVHSAQKARETLSFLSTLENTHGKKVHVSLDLMAGIPEQTMESWQASLAEAIESGVGHISVYPLTVEDGTSFATQLEEGLKLPDEDAVADMLEEASRMLTAAGFVRYETSNYAKPGQESQHNLAYWSGIPYRGIGPGAASMVNTREGRLRFTWTDNVSEYLQEPLSPPVNRESLTIEQRAAEDLMLGLRRSEGVGETDLERLYSDNPRLRDTVEELLASGLLEATSTHIRIPEQNWLLGNEVFRRIWTIAEV